MPALEENPVGNQDISGDDIREKALELMKLQSTPLLARNARKEFPMKGRFFLR